MIAVEGKLPKKYQPYRTVLKPLLSQNSQVSCIIIYKNLTWTQTHVTLLDIFYLLMNGYELIMYSILINFCISLKLVMLIKTCLNDTCSKVHIGKNLLDAFSIHTGLKQVGALLP
jgi:hypothetical protein